MKICDKVYICVYRMYQDCIHVRTYMYVCVATLSRASLPWQTQLPCLEEASLSSSSGWPLLFLQERVLWLCQEPAGWGAASVRCLSTQHPAPARLSLSELNLLIRLCVFPSGLWKACACRLGPGAEGLHLAPNYFRQTITAVIITVTSRQQCKQAHFKASSSLVWIHKVWAYPVSSWGWGKALFKKLYIL